MNDRRYYAERRGLLRPEPMDFEMIKKIFLWKFEKLENELYFHEATGFECVDQGLIRGRWGTDIESFFI